MRLALCLLLLLGAPSVALAHVGSPDVVHEGAAGPYRLLVGIKPPQVIPGVAEIEVTTSDADVRTLELVPLPLSGDGAKFAPTPDVAQPVPGAGSTWVARLWMMSAGSWQVRITAIGARGSGTLAVPVPALPSRTAGMQRALGLGLFALMLVLALGVVSIAGAGVAEAQLPAGEAPDGARSRRSRWVMAGVAALMIAVLWGGRKWWDAEENDYARYVYKPLEMNATVENGALQLTLKDPGWLRSRKLDDLVPDHGHVLHLYLLRVPELDRVWHLHPTASSESSFQHPLPPELPAGRYQLFADLVHATGLAETAVAELELPASAGSPLPDPDDAGGFAPPLSTDSDARRSSLLSSGQMIWEHDAQPLHAGRIEWLRFRVEEPDGQPTHELEPYMGMLGHAAIVRDDRTVFAHIHPSGSVSMASLALASGDPHAGHLMSATATATVGFPFRFPRAGRYRIFVQVKRRGRIETAAFTTRVD